MGKSLNNTGKLLFASEGRARYDTQAVNLIKNRQLLAWILQDCVEEFAGMTREEIIPYIDDVSARYKQDLRMAQTRMSQSHTPQSWEN